VARCNSHGCVNIGKLHQSTESDLVQVRLSLESKDVSRALQVVSHDVLHLGDGDGKRTLTKGYDLDLALGNRLVMVLGFHPLFILLGWFGHGQVFRQLRTLKNSNGDM
jgi:hypothetical protein